ncbi:hypothetical protein N7468_007749 [Penicillium chermesinum]|uniref:Xylanolytic transcriptional activator regulatory domain-containing protein n=1 Tax=Penicillium chermesinum TaxID=63820 RepID=A0A9W9NXJ5_9EURO|nr:uncharacterized protein N7468_007749 [Penicillium chermesinum]KAJ5226524.1 hypothetical protein N7468_007749 [Penicillium chermesinum]
MQATLMDFNTSPTYQYAPSQRRLPWPSIASDAHHPGFRLPGLDASAGEIHAEHVAVVKEMLARLRRLDLIEKLLNEYYTHSPAALVPGPLVLPAVVALRTHMNDVSASAVATDDPTLPVAERIIQSTLADIHIDVDLAPSKFCESYAGKSLRLEAIGLLFALAGRSCLLSPGRDDWRDEFVNTMFRCSTCCLQLAREIAPQVNDPMVWLSYENLLLTMSIQGDASPNVWRRLGDLSTDVYALGVHRESTHAGKVPFYISECRRKMFASAYQVDKLICTFFDRPPRILRRYADCKMPLDLTDDEILVAADEVERVGLLLDSEGWSATARFTSSTWARLRYILGVFREEVLEFPFRPLTTENKAKLMQESFRKMPAGMERFTRPPQIYTPMLDIGNWSYISADIIEVIVQLGKSRDKAILLRHDFPYVVVNYGLPSAATLVAALQTITKSQRPAPLQNLSRSALIRSLVVFTSYLESIGDTGEAIHSTCVQAAQVISRTLDNMLDEPPSTSNTTPVVAGTSMFTDLQSALFSPSEFLQSGLDTSFPNFDLLNSNALDGVDLSGWLNDITWTNKFSG